VARPLRLRPSVASDPGDALVIRTELGARLPLVGDPEMALLGEALHAFLACDDRGLGEGPRRDRARAILARWGVSESLAPADAVAASDRLWAFLQSRFPDARIRREVPVHALLGGQEVVGRIDLLVESGEGFAIVDHKSFPGRRDLWEAKAASHAPQLALYAEAVASVTGGRCLGTFVHMPIVGVMAELGPGAQPA
jgi:pimeloyl-ACP methyl ester carboxylesterase